MKAKLKFDKGQLKTFFVLHVEKIVFAGFVLALLMIAWSALKMKPYDKTPQELQAVADRISKQVEEQQPPEKFEKLAHVPNFTGLGVAGADLVDASYYRIEPLERPYQEHDVRRAMPKFLPVQELLAFSGYGAIAIGESGSVSRVAGGMADMGDDISGYMGDRPGAGMDAASMMQYIPPPDTQGSGGRRTPGAMMGPEAMGGMMQGAMGSGMDRPGQGGMAGGAKKTTRSEEKKREMAEKKKKLEELRRAEEAAALAARKKAAGEHVLPSAPGNSQLEGRYWVCLVGAIPYAAQFKEYRETFRDSTYPDKSRNYPKYVRPDIERAEVVAGQEPEWESINVLEAWDDARTWAAEYPDVVPFEFVDAIAEPLPALIGADFEPAEVVHPKVAQLAEQKAAEAEQAALEKEEKSKAKKPRGRGTLREADRPGRGMPGGAMGLGRMGPMAGGRGGAMGAGGMMGGYGMPDAGTAGGYGMGGYGGGAYGGSGMGGYGMIGGGLAGMRGGADARKPEQPPEWKLFRFFDFEADPGKTYQYRVKLVFENPNFNVPIRYLENYDDREGENREAEWSEPSPPVTVRHGSRMLAGPLGKEVGGEPTIELAVKQFNQDEASEARRFVTARRGAVLNEAGAKVLVPDHEAMQDKTGREVEIDFQTDTLLLDILGGDSISVGRGPKVKSPGHVLVMRSDGQFAVLDEALDSQTFEMEKAEHNELKAPEEEGAGGADGALNPFSFGIKPEEKPKKPKRR